VGNPIHLGMAPGSPGLAIVLDSFRLPVPFVLVIRYSVFVREEASLEREFGDVSRRCRARPDALAANQPSYCGS
jgi:hypothetical protein